MENKKKSLSLDELFGEEQPIIIVWQGKDYKLRNPSSFGPGDLKKWRQLGIETDVLNKIEGELTDAQAQALEDAVQKSVELLNKGLSEKEMPFGARVKILEFYTENLVGDDKGSKKKET